jgi:hypothetical protein
MAVVSSCCDGLCKSINCSKSVLLSQATSETCVYNCQRRIFLIGHIVETAMETSRKVQATVGLYAPNPLGYTRATMVWTMGCNSVRRS